MYSPQYRPHTDHTQYTENGGGGRRPPPRFSISLLWSVYGLYCGLYMAYGQLMYGPYMAYVWPMYGLYMATYVYNMYIHIYIYGHIWPVYGLRPRKITNGFLWMAMFERSTFISWYIAQWELIAWFWSFIVHRCPTSNWQIKNNHLSCHIWCCSQKRQK